MASLFHFMRKLNKGLALARVPVWRKGLTSGVAAAIEHRDCLSDLDFSTCIDVGANSGQFSLLIRGIVRRQNIWRSWRCGLAECGRRLGFGFRPRACGVASADVRWSVA
jgi:hypothetical protein